MLSLLQRIKPTRVILPPPARQPFYLMQRLVADPSATDGLLPGFSLEDMAAAEFEWSAPEQSLKRLHSARKRLYVHTLAQDFFGITRPVYFLDNVDTASASTDAFTHWFSAEREDSKRNSRLRQAYTSTEASDTAAWWALKADVFVSLDKNVIDTLRNIFTA